MHKYTHRSSQAGVVSLFSVLFFTILITVLTVGFIRIMINERRQATDDDLTTRAYYAAESGVEEMKRALQQYYPNPADRSKLNATTCDAPVGYNKTISTQASVGYSCKLINTNPPDIQATLPGDGKTMQWPLKAQGGADFNKIRISWHSLSDATDGPAVAFRATGSTAQNPAYSGWSSGGNPFPAMLRMQMFAFPNSGTFNRSNIDALNSVAFLNPADPGTTGDQPITNLNSSVTPSNGDCTTNASTYGGYACQATIVINPGGYNPLSQNIFLRLKGLYDTNGTKVKIELLQGSTVINTEEAQGFIDVTGRAGDVYRRVQARVNLPGAIDTTLLPEYAVDSGDEICKRFEVSDVAEFLNGCQVR